MELFDVYDKNRIKTGKILKRGDKLNNDEYHIFVQVWLVNKNNEFLFEKRSSFVTSPHKWCAVGGHVISGEDSLDACLRETREEIGVDLSRFDGEFVSSTYYTLNNQNYFCDTYLYLIDEECEFKLQKEEVEEVRFIGLVEFEKMIEKGITFDYTEEYLSIIDFEAKKLIKLHK